MARLRSILMTLIAVLALCSPSFAAAIRWSAAGPVAVAGLSVSAATPHIQLKTPCQGGKRVMPCQLDFGMATRPEALAAPVAARFRLLRDEPMQREHLPDSMPRPPRGN